MLQLLIRRTDVHVGCANCTNVVPSPVAIAVPFRCGVVGCALNELVDVLMVFWRGGVQL